MEKERTEKAKGILFGDSKRVLFQTKYLIARVRRTDSSSSKSDFL